VIIGPQYVPLERLGPRVHLLPAQRRIGNWLGIADVLCHPSDYESHCFTINEAWLAGVPVVSCDYLVNRLFEDRHGPMMWLVPIRPEPAQLAEAIGEAYERRSDGTRGPRSGSREPRVRRAGHGAALVGPVPTCVARAVAVATPIPWSVENADRLLFPRSRDRPTRVRPTPAPVSSSGSGHWDEASAGAAVRQWLDGGVQPWRTRLVGVEGFDAYRSPCWNVVRRRGGVVDRAVLGG
jgi:hypothetical protein